MKDEELVELLRKSHQKNVPEDITGMLLYKDGSFMQVMEGPEENVFRLYNRILEDPRHKGIITLLKGPLEKREFGNWSMAFQNIDKLSPEDRAASSSFLNEPFTKEAFGPNPHNAMKLLLSFKEKLR